MDKVSKEIEHKAQEIARKGDVRKVLETEKRVHFSIQGETEEHSVIYDKARGSYACDCRYFALQRKECSHIVSARMIRNDKSN